MLFFLSFYYIIELNFNINGDVVFIKFLLYLNKY